MRKFLVALIPLALMCVIISHFPYVGMLIAGWQIGTWSGRFADWYTRA